MNQRSLAVFVTLTALLVAAGALTLPYAAGHHAGGPPPSYFPYLFGLPLAIAAGLIVARWNGARISEGVPVWVGVLMVVIVSLFFILVSRQDLDSRWIALGILPVFWWAAMAAHARVGNCRTQYAAMLSGGLWLGWSYVLRRDDCSHNVVPARVLENPRGYTISGMSVISFLHRIYRKSPRIVCMVWSFGQSRQDQSRARHG